MPEGGSGRGAPRAQGARRRMLAQEVARRGDISVEDLIDGSEVSATTVYRDLASLEEAGLIRREWGRVIAVARGPHEAPAKYRLIEHTREKREMAAHLVGQVSAGCTLMVDDSTSSAWAVRALGSTSPLTLVTNSLLVAREVEQFIGIDLYLTGGVYEPWAQSVLGESTIRAVSALRGDLCVLSASGLGGDQCFHPKEQVVAVKRAMMAACDRSVLLLDHSKLERRAMHAFARLIDFDQVIVDSQTPAEDVERLTQLGARVEVALPLPNDDH